MYRRIKQPFLLGTLNSKHVLKPLCAGTVWNYKGPTHGKGAKGGLQHWTRTMSNNAGVAYGIAVSAAESAVSQTWILT